LIYRPVRVLGGPVVRAASGASSTLIWLPRPVVGTSKAAVVLLGLH
jgi:hypothetical protein